MRAQFPRRDPLSNNTSPTDVPVAGTVDLVDNYAFVRTSGYVPEPEDVYVSVATVKRYGLRPGDEVTGAARATVDPDERPAGGGGRTRKDKHRPLTRVDTIHGMDP